MTTSAAAPPPALQNLRIGTISFDLDQPVDNLSQPELIFEVIIKHRPDILLTAGYGVPDNSALDALSRLLDSSDWDGLLVVEVKNYTGGPPKDSAGALNISDHCTFSWTKWERWRTLGRQMFSTSEQAKSMTNGNIEAFETALAGRSFDFRGHTVTALICGELNALQGRNSVQPLTGGIGAALDRANIVFNPTHDLMGNAGTVKNKRSYLSRNGRICISVSNWASQKQPKRKTREPETLHAAYIDGAYSPMTVLLPRSPLYEYREIRV